MGKLMGLMSKLLNNKVLLYLIKSYLGKEVFKTMLESLFKKLLPNILRSVMSNPEVQEWFRDLGRQAGEEIPNDIAEPQIKKALELIGEGLMDTVNK